MTSARFGAILPANSWVAADATNTADATAPATAWLPIPTTPDRNAARRKANKPVTAKPANAAMAAIVKTPRTSAGHREPLQSEGSRTLRGLRHHEHRRRRQHHHRDVHDERQVQWLRCVLNQQSGQQGPPPRPPTLAAVATAAARFCHVAGAASMTAAVAVPVKMPADNPDSTRPTSSSVTESAIRNTTALTKAGHGAGQPQRPPAHGHPTSRRRRAVRRARRTRRWRRSPSSSERRNACGRRRAHTSRRERVPTMMAAKAYASRTKA